MITHHITVYDCRVSIKKKEQLTYLLFYCHLRKLSVVHSQDRTYQPEMVTPGCLSTVVIRSTVVIKSGVYQQDRHQQRQFINMVDRLVCETQGKVCICHN